MFPWPLILQAIPAVLGAIPKVQALFGTTKDEAHGASKLQSALDFVVSEVPDLEALLGVDPKWEGIIKAAISLVYEALKVSGKLPDLTAAAAAKIAAAPSPVAIGDQPAPAGG